MNVLLLLSLKDVRGMLSFTLESKYGARVLEARTAAHAKQILDKRNESIDLFVFEFSDENRPLAKSLYDLTTPPRCIAVVESQGDEEKTKIILNSLKGPEKKNSAVMISPVSKDVLVEMLFSIMDQVKGGLLGKLPTEESAADITTTDEERNFVKIRSDLLLRVIPLRSPVYIKLSAKKFIKLFNSGDVYDQQDHSKYGQVKSIEYFYLRVNETEEFLKKFIDDMARILSLEDLPIQSVMETSSAVHEMVQELIDKLGVTEKVQDIIRSNVKLTVKSMSSMPKLKHLLSGIEREKTKYISYHSTRLAQITCSVASLMEWSSETTYQKLSYASFLHDITLKNQNLAAVQSLDELNKRGVEFTDEEIDAYKLHPNQAADIAKRFKEIPADVDSIIAQHHELPDGNGFPRAMHASRINPLSAIFIVTHDLLHYIYLTGKDFRLLDFVAKSEKKYGSGVFKKVLSVFADLKI
jgi:response regulator RpfG family c-di-GMP phosphodiesterase